MPVISARQASRWAKNRKPPVHSIKNIFRHISNNRVLRGRTSQIPSHDRALCAAGPTKIQRRKQKSAQSSIRPEPRESQAVLQKCRKARPKTGAKAAQKARGKVHELINQKFRRSSYGLTSAPSSPESLSDALILLIKSSIDSMPGKK